ncbi:MAG: ParB/RepB/Spo0J family partition protein [Candidatus Competibacteraceae bacterium]|nr:ParB/RepB/Spo0J family partition protein [Candidatus Competibacteraceae bacterium]
MTSGEFTLFPIAAITIERDTRQRRELPDIEGLAESIRTTGLIHPIVITREGKLVAGERRLTACTSIGWTDIPAQYADTLDPIELHAIELEENVRRVDLTWVERSNAIEEYHKMRLRSNPEHTVEDTADALNMSRTVAYKNILVATELHKDPEIAKIENFSTALGVVQRKIERSGAAALREALVVQATPIDAATPAEPAAPKRFAQLLNTNFLDWMKTPIAEPFNLIHCDFPYGVNTGDKKGQSAAKAFGTYEDSQDIYFTLLDMMLFYQDNFIAPSAHMLFWFSMNFYEETKRRLTDRGWSVNPMPLIWAKSDNAGIIPDTNRGPRQIYETALLCSRGDRKIVKPVANLCWTPTTKEFHTSEKSLVMLSHFFRMLVDESTRMLDPTCGSGMAVKASEQAGAAFSLGLERDLDFFTGAMHNLRLGGEE